ncbi:lysM domain receptor-like kinase 3 isoform X1 [Amaranthus tricolor]|uniref:lysM domain receptor-like kinase 3 isoform X1 n=1 Tax=Amaranthus tricolor TaxID=29722 RepID=UPI0025843E68|nr:lysM domain receptor-like kinase 3 isoform X1 [Amaranthus tricolor]
MYPFIILLTHLWLTLVESKCHNICNLALASYHVLPGSTLDHISMYFSNHTISDEIVSYNRNKLQNKDILPSNIRINIPFLCGCVNDTFLGHIFTYTFQKGDTYEKVAKYNYTNLTFPGWIEKFNGYSPYNVPDGTIINIPVRCSCGDESVSKDYGLFITYPLLPGESLRSISSEFNLNESLLQGYNPGVNFSAGTGFVYIPGKDKNGTYPPLVGSNGKSSAGLGVGAIGGVCIAGIFLIIIAVGSCFVCKRTKKTKKTSVVSEKPEYQLTHSSSFSQDRDTGGIPGISSVEFSYEELAKATNNFNASFKIGAGGFGEVYFAELRGEKAAIKKMDMEASREFLAELKVLTRVHHLHLVHLLGFCVEGSLFLIYEFIDNGNLSEHLRYSSGRNPLPWTTRVQIALDAAKGLEYIHEHTDPVYIHRDIKPANILINKNFQAKVADFGLTKLAEVGNATLPTRLVGTFGYMPPEYAQFGEVTPKVDVYAFGVVLYQLISAKAAVVKQNRSTFESKSLVALFDVALSHPDPNEICKLVDPQLGDDYPLDSVRQVAELARACTQDNAMLRPSMRSVVVALTTMSSTTQNWDIESFYRNSDLLNLVSGR